MRLPLLGNDRIPSTMAVLGVSALLLGACATNAPAGGVTGGKADLGGTGSTGGGSGGNSPDLLAAVIPPDLAPPAPDLSTAPPDLTNIDLTPLPDLVIVGSQPGEVCAVDTDCMSQMCRPVVAGGALACVSNCTSQADCAAYPGLICEAITVGGTAGYCIPHSNVHCGMCTQDSDCGSLTERCIQPAGDNSMACHVDCALAGADACPPDYECSMVADGAAMRSLCVPKLGVCLDAIGGYCDRASLPQPCVRSDSAGTCTGNRQCLMVQGRYDMCDATAPQFKTDCTSQDPAGCQLMLSPSVIATVTDCGACGNACPGNGLTTCVATCTDPPTKSCGLSCIGENYDVDGNPANGCEKADADPPGHNQQTASARPSLPCNDGNTDSFSSTIASDARVHANPAIDGFIGTVGASPDYWSVDATGGTFCTDDYSVTFTTSGGGATPCYRCTFQSDKTTNSVTVSGSGNATMSDSSSGQYNDNSTIFFIIEKTCSLPVQEYVTYTVNYHL